MVGAQYKLPWEILAGIGLEERDQGRDPDPSCAPQPAATGPGLANFAGTPAGQPVAAYALYVREHNGSGPADAYAARVLADAHAYQRAGTVAFGPSCGAALGTPLVPGTKAKILASGDAAAPADAPVVVQQTIAAATGSTISLTATVAATAIRRRR